MKNKMYRVVIDTNVFISALKSRNGASFKLLFKTDYEKYTNCISTPLLFEYESVAKREIILNNLTNDDIDIILDKLCQVYEKCKVFFLWRPFLKDPHDDFILELAVESQSDFIITYNTKDFNGSEQFNIKAITPKEFLEIIGEI
jgi:putative PIN family toxin of toxin-antitoxin system